MTQKQEENRRYHITKGNSPVCINCGKDLTEIGKYGGFDCISSTEENKKFSKLVGVCNCICHCGLDNKCFTDHDKECEDCTPSSPPEEWELSKYVDDMVKEKHKTCLTNQFDNGMFWAYKDIQGKIDKLKQDLLGKEKG